MTCNEASACRERNHELRIQPIAQFHEVSHNSTCTETECRHKYHDNVALFHGSFLCVGATYRGLGLIARYEND
jgi:hypothetical protein